MLTSHLLVGRTIDGSVDRIRYALYEEVLE
jgi:hypothetical protein